MVYREQKELGGITLELRQLPLLQQIREALAHQGRFNYLLGLFYFYAYIPLFLLPVCALMMSAPFWLASDCAMTVLLGRKSPTVVLVTLFPINYLLCGWYVFYWPRMKYLVVHEDGIRGRWPWKRFAVRFDDIKYLLVGKTSSARADARLSLLSITDPARAREFAYTLANSISLVLLDGTRISLGYLFSKFEPVDVVRLLGILSAKVAVDHGDAVFVRNQEKE